jgi:hypothetical protein
MDQRNDGFGNLFADSSQPQYHTYDTPFLNGPDHQNFTSDASWGLNASAFPASSQAGQQSVQAWSQNANHLSASSTHGGLNGPGSPYSRSLSHSPAPFAQNPYGGFNSQQSLQYRQSPYDPSLYNTTNVAQTYGSNNFSGFPTQAQSAGTIAPQALQQETRSPAFANHPYATVNRGQPALAQQSFARPSAPPVDQKQLLAAIPKGSDAGSFSVIDADQLRRATNSERMTDYVYINVGKEAQEWPANRTTTLPQYVPRKSKNELRKLAGNDQSLLAKIGKKALKKTPLGIAPSGARQFTGPKGPGSPTESIKYEGDSSSDDESSDDESSYTSDEDLEGSPLQSKRPDNPKEAVEYDTTKALWRPKRRPVSGESIKQGMVAFWEIIRTIRDRWKTDTQAVTEAEEKKRAGEIPLLKSRVKDQRDMIEAAFKAALKHGHRSIVEMLGQNHPLIYLCYQFLLDRFKAEDLNSGLSRAILEILSLVTTLDTEVLEKTHLNRVLSRYSKLADAKTAFYAKRILTNAAESTKQKASQPAPKAAASAKSTGNTASPPAKRLEPGTVAGVKRASSSAVEGGAQKKVATTVSKANGSAAPSKSTSVVKKPANSGDSPKPPGTGSVSTNKAKQITAKPSNFFSSLQSAAKKPGTSIKAGTPVQAAGPKVAERKSTATSAPASAAPKSTFSFAETMANLTKSKEVQPAAQQEKEEPLESPEEKAKRLRKEARRKLHVQFKIGEDLVQVRYFTHDPEEELGHDDSQMRDVADAGGEGRALKLHKDMMDLDEEDDADEEPQLTEWKEPSATDFSDVDREERDKNYSKYAGGKNEPESPERAAREQYEKDNLIVFYADASEIPPNPREPSDPYNGQQRGSATEFGKPDQKWIDLAKQRIQSNPRLAQRQQQSRTAAQPAFDLSRLLPQQPPMMTQPPPAAPNFDLNTLLANLTQNAAQQQQTAQAPPMMNYGQAYQPPPPVMNGVPASTQPDLGAILAAIGGEATQAPQMCGGYGAATSAPTIGSFAPQMLQRTGNSSRGGGSGGGGGGGSQNKQRWRDQSKGDNVFYKTVPCKFWPTGECLKGDKCTYLHENPK